MNKRILFSLVSIGTMALLVGSATYAYFSNSGTSTGNTFSTGTLDLKLSDSNETALDSVTASFGSTLSPGTCTGNQTLSFRNEGTVVANHAEVAIANVVTDTNNDATPDMDSFLRINSLTYDSTDVSGQITDANLNGYKDLSDWEASLTALDNLALTDLNVNHSLVMDICLDNTAGNPIQGDSISSTFTVTLNQNSSQ